MGLQRGETTSMVMTKEKCAININEDLLKGKEKKMMETFTMIKKLCLLTIMNRIK